jgi:protein-S-isoprenylcysteine O-methyltransferase Ste14
VNNLNLKAFSGLVFLTIIIGLALFLSAGTTDYPQAWIFITLFFLSTAAITFYLMKKDPALLERRVKAGPTAEKQASQKVIQSIAQIAFLSTLLLPGFDRRFQWTHVPTAGIIVGDLLVVGGLLIVFLVFKENTFTSATIEVGKDQEVISTGPYSIVRHPMYSGALIMLFGMPLALGSWIGLVSFLPMLLVIVSRLFEEEKYLTEHLAGYRQYCSKVHSRLIPGIF